MSEFEYTGKDALNVMLQARNYNNSILNIIKSYVRKDDRVLDFGAGIGGYCNRLLDYSIEAVELDKSFHKYIKCGVHSDMSQIRHTFDIIFSANVLEHIEDDSTTLAQLNKLLNDDGRLILFVPAMKFLFSKMDELVGHFRRYGKKELYQKVENAGFKIDSLEYFDFLGFFATLIYKLVGNTGKIEGGSLRFYDKLIFPISRFMDKILFKFILGKNLILVATKNPEGR